MLTLGLIDAAKKLNSILVKFASIIETSFAIKATAWIYISSHCEWTRERERERDIWSW